ncbi:MAG: T9SS type A sorting domain-containing protein [Bacteroidota bacterium]
MKKIIVSVLLGFSLHGIAQTPVSADPAIFNFAVLNTTNDPIVASTISNGQVVKIKVPLENTSQTTAIPEGTCVVSIGLGTKMIVNPGFDLSTAPLSAIFNWSTSIVGGQIVIYGTIKTGVTLPADFSDYAIFELQASGMGSSSLQGNFFISNGNPLYTLSDEHPENNATSTQYTVTAILPVTFLSVNASAANCNMNIVWKTENEIGLDHYEVEFSKDGLLFEKLASVKASQAGNYEQNIAITDAMRAPYAFLRIKSVDKDGTSKYSQQVHVKDGCQLKSGTRLQLYPNPVTTINFVNVSVKSGLALHGKYKVTITDALGKVVEVKEVELNNQTQFKLTLPTLQSGKYFVTVRDAAATVVDLLSFDKIH